MQSSAAPALLASDDLVEALPEALPESSREAEPDRALVAARRSRLRLVRPGEAGTTTAEYTVVTAAAVAFGALLLKLLTGSWGTKILETAFRGVIKMLGF